jgi:drug/metabolite transporter (DMT)-like permease
VTAERRTERWALGAAALVGIQVGACIAGSRWLMLGGAQGLGPLSLTFLRYAIALATLLPLLALFGGTRAGLARLTAGDAIRVALLGIVQFGVLIALLNFGLKHVDAGLGALLFATFPLMTLAIATAAGHERFDGPLAAGVLLSIVGVGLALGVHPPAIGGAGFALGAACVLGAALCGAMCSVLYRPLLRRHATLPLGTLAMGAAVAALAPAASAEGLAAQGRLLTPAQWAAVVAIGLSSGVSYWVWLWALKHTAPTKATTFLALSPVTAALIGLFALGEPISAGLVGGVVCIVLGLVLTASRRVSPASAPQSP